MRDSISSDALGQLGHHWPVKSSMRTARLACGVSTSIRRSSSSILLQLPRVIATAAMAAESILCGLMICVRSYSVNVRLRNYSCMTE